MAGAVHRRRPLLDGRAGPIAIRKSSKAIAILDPDRYVEDDLTEEDELAILDETKETLAGRVARLETGMAWAEDPPSRTRHLITNIEVEPGDSEAEVKVYSNFIVYRSRGGDRAGFLCRGAPGRAAARRRRAGRSPAAR